MIDFLMWIPGCSSKKAVKNTQTSIDLLFSMKCNNLFFFYSSILFLLLFKFSIQNIKLEKITGKIFDTHLYWENIFKIFVSCYNLFLTHFLSGLQVTLFLSLFIFFIKKYISTITFFNFFYTIKITNVCFIAFFFCFKVF